MAMCYGLDFCGLSEFSSSLGSQHSLTYREPRLLDFTHTSEAK